MIISLPEMGKNERRVVAIVLLIFGGFLIFVVSNVAISLVGTDFSGASLTYIVSSPVGYVLIAGSFGVAFVLGGVYLIKSTIA
jgi:hypothetical protein